MKSGARDLFLIIDLTSEVYFIVNKAFRILSYITGVAKDVTRPELFVILYTTIVESGLMYCSVL